MTTLEVLEKAKSLLADPSKWCKGSTFQGDKMCILGATIKAANMEISEEGECRETDAYESAVVALAQARCVNGWGPVLAQFNDQEATSHEKLMGLFDLTISREREKESK